MTKEIDFYSSKDVPRGRFVFGHEDPEDEERIIVLHEGDDRLAHLWFVVGIAKHWFTNYPNAILSMILNPQDAEEGFWFEESEE